MQLCVVCFKCGRGCNALTCGLPVGHLNTGRDRRGVCAICTFNRLTLGKRHSCRCRCRCQRQRQRQGQQQLSSYLAHTAAPMHRSLTFSACSRRRGAQRLAPNGAATAQSPLAAHIQLSLPWRCSACCCLWLAIHPPYRRHHPCHAAHPTVRRGNISLNSTN